MAPNNLHKMIVRSGLKSNMVAELKGIQPPTLSRHKNGDIGISLTDAEEYAKIYDSMSCKDGIPLRDSGYQLKLEERLEVVKLAHANAKPIWEKEKAEMKR